MATMTHRGRGAHRTRQAKLEELLRQHGSILRNRRQTLQDCLPTETSGVVDDEERSLDAEEQWVGSSLLELTHQTLRGIQSALQRLEAGEFGKCSECGGKISEARLRAMPTASLCLACQGEHDTPGVPRSVARQPPMVRGPWS